VEEEMVVPPAAMPRGRMAEPGREKVKDLQSNLRNSRRMLSRFRNS
jgi:hypothetical protein